MILIKDGRLSFIFCHWQPVTKLQYICIVCIYILELHSPQFEFEQNVCQSPAQFRRSRKRIVLDGGCDLLNRAVCNKEAEAIGERNTCTTFTSCISLLNLD